MDYLKEFAEKLKEARVNKHLRQSTLSVKAGLSANAVHYYETCRSSPSLEAICKLAKALNLHPGSLMPSEKKPWYQFPNAVSPNAAIKNRETNKTNNNMPKLVKIPGEAPTGVFQHGIKVEEIAQEVKKNEEVNPDAGSKTSEHSVQVEDAAIVPDHSVQVEAHEKLGEELLAQEEALPKAGETVIVEIDGKEQEVELAADIVEVDEEEVK